MVDTSGPCGEALIKAPRSVQHVKSGTTLVLLLALAGLAGCLQGPTSDDATLGAGGPGGASDAGGADGVGGGTAEPGPLRIDGVVQDITFRAIEGAAVTLVDLGRTVATDAGGSFSFTDIQITTFRLNVSAEGYEPWSQVVRSEGRTEVALTVQLVAVTGPEPYNVSVPHQGFIECGVDILIISGSCGRVLGEYTPVEDPFQSEAAFEHEATADWKTVIVDVSWQELPPTLAGLRVSAYNWNASDDLGNYERFNQAWGEEPFTLRVDAGATYADGIPVPTDPTLFRFEVFPHSHLYKTICDPNDESTCFLGVGAGANIEFELVITAFFHEPAPEGWTIRDA